LWAASDHDGQDFSIVKTNKALEAPLDTEEETEYKIYTQTFYSESEIILGVAYRVQAEAQVIPRHLLQIQDDEKEQDNVQYNMNHEVLVCRFELQRGMKSIAIPIKKEKKIISKEEEKKDEAEKEIITHQTIPKKAQIHYWIYCLNRHEGVLENDKVDPEDRMLVPVTEQEERGGEMGPGYVGQVLIDADLKRGVTIDTTVALEIFGLPKV
jgi:hypothetical protein